MSARVDFFVGLFLVAFSAAAYYIADQLPKVKKGLGAGDYPKVVIRVLLVLGALLAATALYRLIKKAQPDEKKYAKGELVQVLVLLGCIALYFVLVRRLGYLALTPLFMVAMMYLYGVRKWLKMAVIAVATTAVTYLIFNRFLFVLLPRFNLF